jgi:hypothetical protein
MDASLSDPELKLFMDGSSFVQVGRERPGSQSPLLTTSYRLKPYHKDGPHTS